MSALLVAGSVLLAFASAWELAGSVEGRAALIARRVLGRVGASHGADMGAAVVRLGLAGRIERAGLAGHLRPGAAIALKCAGFALGGLVAAIVLPAAPERFAVPVAGGLVAAGFLAPDAFLERLARRRRERAVAALADVLDMLAVGSGTGRGPAAVLAEIASATTGPLASELAAAVAEIEAGAPAGEAFATLRRRLPAPQIAALVAALDRSRVYGSPLAEQLQLHATSLRHDERRRIEERAARAAPKIQLVVALVLVPSVLLVILAAILAHADALFGAL